MRRIAGVSTVFRAANGGAVASSVFGRLAQQQHRLLEAALFSSNRNTSSERSPWFSYNKITGDHSARSFSGTMLFSTAAGAVVENVQAKEFVQPKFRPRNVVLFQYEACPFCNKVRAFLDYHDIPYKVVEVNPINKSQIGWCDYKKVPILMVDGEQMVDSTVIIDKLTKKINPELSTASAKRNQEEMEWRSWVDNHLVHVLSPNIYRNPAEALESFDYITSQGNFSFFEKLTAKYAGAAAMYFVSRKLKKKHGITDERAALYDAADKWVFALQGRQFLGGSKPNLADLAVYGVLRPIRYLKSGKDMVEHTRIGDWYSRMENAIGASSRLPELAK